MAVKLVVMGRLAILLVLLGGCAQLFGLDETSKAIAVDAPIVGMDGPPPIDAKVCSGGDSYTTDTATGNCYILFKAPAIRNAARATCQTVGAKLVSIQSATENSLVLSLAGPIDTFLGGNDEVTEGTFVWEDGSAVVLTNWNTATGEPNNGLGMLEEDCIVMRGDAAGKWDDRPCAVPPSQPTFGSYQFVCER